MEQGDQGVEAQARVMICSDKLEQPLPRLWTTELSEDTNRGNDGGALRVFVQRQGERFTFTIQALLLFFCECAQDGGEQVTDCAVTFDIVPCQDLKQPFPRCRAAYGKEHPRTVDLTRSASSGEALQGWPDCRLTERGK